MQSVMIATNVTTRVIEVYGKGYGPDPATGFSTRLV